MFCEWFKNIFKKSELMPGFIVYQINDPTTPDLIIKVPVPIEPQGLKVKVNGYQGACNELRTPASDSANCAVTLSKSINYFQKQISNPLNKWAVTRLLTAHPRAGKQLNAYYDRRNLKFFYAMHPTKKKMIYTVESTDIVAHELGHALLDAMRPDFWNVQALEIWSFHEAFADINAVVTVMQFNEVLDKALKQTGGNLRKDNVISRLAEEVGSAVFPTGFLRNASNKFKYISPEKLPKQAPNNKLARECHSFGRIFLGTWYDCMTDLFEHKRQKMDSITALKSARDITYNALLRAIPKTPRVARYHEAIGRVMIAQATGPFKKILVENLKARNIIKPQIKALSERRWEDVISAAAQVTTYEDFSTSVNVPESKTIKLSDYLPSAELTALSTGKYDLSQVEIEVPTDSFYEFDRHKNLVSEIVSDDAEIVETVRASLESSSIGPDEDTMWAVEDNKLVRTYIQ